MVANKSQNRRKISNFVAFLELNNGIVNLYRRKKIQEF